MGQGIALREWGILLVAATCFGTLACVAFLKSEGSAKKVENSTGRGVDLDERRAEVTLVGAVRRPGSYSLSDVKTLYKLLEVGEPLGSADLRRFRKDRLLHPKEQVEVPHKPQLVIYVQGEVAGAKVFAMPRGSQLKDLLPLVQPLPGADLSVLAGRRKLRHNEVIVIPKKQERLSKKEEDSSSFLLI